MRKLLSVLSAAMLACVLAVVSPVSMAVAVEPDEILSNPVLEARARHLSAELRCLVCQNQSIDDSNAPLARDLRLLVRERLKAGDKDDQIIDYVVARYGEFVLLRPSFSAATIVLWLAPLALLGVALLLARGVMRTRAVTGGPAEQLSADEKARLAAILDERAGND